jgi:hypothetical protein
VSTKFGKTPAKNSVIFRFLFPVYTAGRASYSWQAIQGNEVRTFADLRSNKFEQGARMNALDDLLWL